MPDIPSDKPPQEPGKDRPADPRPSPVEPKDPPRDPGGQPDYGGN